VLPFSMITNRSQVLPFSMSVYTYVGRLTRDRGTIFVSAEVVETFPLFPTGQTVMTSSAEARLIELDIDPTRYYRQLLDRHLGGDWGLCWVDDLWTNDEAIRLGERIFSVYVTDDVEFWVITEASGDSDNPKGPRSATTLLLPDDF
jgi:hypothetical protein